MNAAQDAYARAERRGSGAVPGHMLHSIAPETCCQAGSELCAWISTAGVATKVSDRGTGQAVGVVADAPFSGSAGQNLMKRRYTVNMRAPASAPRCPRSRPGPINTRLRDRRSSMPEFTSVLSQTGLPDFGQHRAAVVPGKRCLELKSYKMYLLAYRNLASFRRTWVTACFATGEGGQPGERYLGWGFSPRRRLSSVSPQTGAGNVESAELIAILREVRERVREQRPEASPWPTSWGWCTRAIRRSAKWPRSAR